MNDTLKKLVETARNSRPTPVERERQRRSFAYGNTHFENELITRNMIDQMADALEQGES